MILSLHAHKLRKIYSGALHLCYFFPTLRYKDVGALHLIGYNVKGQRPVILVENGKGTTRRCSAPGYILSLNNLYALDEAMDNR
jgi:hypothetical protein